MNPGAGSRSCACSEAAAAQPRTARPGRPLAPPSSAAASAPPARAFVRSQQTLRHLKATLARSPSPECGATCQACGRHPGLAGTGPGVGQVSRGAEPRDSRQTPSQPRCSAGAPLASENRLVRGERCTSGDRKCEQWRRPPKGDTELGFSRTASFLSHSGLVWALTLSCSSLTTSVLPKRGVGGFGRRHRLLTREAPALRPSSTSPGFIFPFLPCPAQFSSHSQQSVLPLGPWPTKQAWS